MYTSVANCFYDRKVENQSIVSWQSGVRGSNSHSSGFHELYFKEKQSGYIA